MAEPQPTVALFVTCLVDLYRPSVGFAAVKLLEDAGCAVAVPAAQTCCGQPAYNSGDKADAADIAKQVIAAFESYDHVVTPSGSCGGMIKHHYPALLANDPAWAARAKQLAARTHELISFLTDVLGVSEIAARCEAKATYHDSCAGLRELGIKDQPRALLAKVEGLTLVEAAKAEDCCGFGGTFSIKHQAISARMAKDKTADAAQAGADLLLGGDLGCLMNLAGRLKREGSAMKVRHAAEVLANMTDHPAIGEGENG